MFQYKIVTVFGGTGFIGRHIVRELAWLGLRIKVASRHPESARYLLPAGNVGQIVPVLCDYLDRESVAEALSGSDFAVNCTGILHEKKKGDFDRIHCRIPSTIADISSTLGIRRLIHISALGIDSSASSYAISKRAGEKVVLSLFPKSVILRPSLVFGTDDSFFNRFAAMARLLPALPLIGGGETRFQPVYVGDVANAAIAALTISESGKDSPLGNIYQIGGPEVFTFRQLMEKIMHYTRRSRRLVNVPWSLARMYGALPGIMPGQLLTGDQVELLRTDNVVSEDALTLEALGISPKDLDAILPVYLERYSPGGHYGSRIPAS